MYVLRIDSILYIYIYVVYYFTDSILLKNNIFTVYYIYIILLYILLYIEKICI